MHCSRRMNDQEEEPGVKVWDPLIRIFHWTLVIMVLFNLMNDEEGQLHQLAGYSVLGLLTFRVLWGFVGPHHARFKNFVARPAEVKTYLKGFIYGHDSHYLGHNPAGGWMVLALLGWLAVTAGTGSMLALPAFTGQGLFEGIHEAFAETLPLMITVHVCGVIVSGLWHRENLVKAMVTGRKPYPEKAGS